MEVKAFGDVGFDGLVKKKKKKRRVSVDRKEMSIPIAFPTVKCGHGMHGQPSTRDPRTFSVKKKRLGVKKMVWHGFSLRGTSFRWRIPVTMIDSFPDGSG